MATQIKTLRLDDDTISAIQEVADAEHSGNFTAAVKDMVNQASAMRSVDEDTRWKLYSGGKRFAGEFDDRLTRKIIDGLHI